jgi:hypothetical protein
MDSKLARLKHRYQGLSRVAAAINDLYIYGIYPGNFPNLTARLEEAKDLVKAEITETKKEIASIEGFEPTDEQPTDPLKQEKTKDWKEIIDNYRV